MLSRLIGSFSLILLLGAPVFAGDEAPAWASPHQFNHCIIAIKISDETRTATVITHPKLGRLLIFDATDDDTLVGDLPDHEQGSLALIVAGASGSLARMPVTPWEVNLVDRRVEASLDQNGSLNAVVREKATGNWAVDFRSEFRHLSHSDYEKAISGWVNRRASAAKLSKVDPRDDSTTGNFDLEVDFTAPAYGQLMQNRLLVFKPAIVSRRDSLTLTDAKRTQPVVLKSNAYSETARVKLPDGFVVDEMPDPVKLDTAFGSYSISYEVADRQLVFTRKLVQHATTIPVDQYDAVRKFFERIRTAEQAPVVLARKKS